MSNKKAVIDRRFHPAWIFTLALTLLPAGGSFAKDLIVDGKNAAAKDANPGTLEAPFKTIQAALDKAQPGDTVQVRGGVYCEAVRFKRGGAYASAAAIFDAAFGPDIQWLTLEAYKDEHVVLDGAKGEIPVIGGKNILDCTTPPDQANEVKYDPSLGLILPATSVASPQFVHVTVWMVLWKNPHPDKPIASLEVKGRNEGIPGLIGVSLGRPK